ncbi:hypothetical protein [Streptomyces sp. NPDC127066]|uniref:hypothetical protein n=1 Tax=Streptomyces sp. NPDC127066 TaxID=3347125 RepID=UPI003667F918
MTVSAPPWMRVAPAHPDTVATALSGSDGLAVVATKTGPANLVAHAATNLVSHALCRDAEPCATA